jgi:hypothetical protein
MAFDPDAYISEKSQAGFDPDAYLQEKQTAPVKASVAPQQQGLMAATEQSLSQHEQNVGNQLAQPERYPFQHVVQTASGVLGEVPAAINPAINRLAGSALDVILSGSGYTSKDVSQEAGQRLAPIGKKLSEISQAHPLASDVAGLGVNALGVLPMGAGAARLTGKIPEAVASGANKFVGKVAEELSGVPEAALRAAGTPEGRATLKAASGTQYEIGQRLVDKMDNAYQAIRETTPKAEQALKGLPVIDPKDIIKKLRSSAGEPTTVELKKAAEQITNKADELQGIADKYYGYVPAEDLYNFRKEIDVVLQDEFGKSSGKYLSALKSARYDIKNTLLDAAKGTEYESTMADMAKKLDAVDKMKGLLGRNVTTQESRAESFVRNINNMGKEQQRKWLNDFQNVFGGDFLNEAKTAQMAEQLGPGGEAAMWPRQKTGRATLGVLSGLALGGVGVIPAAAMTSPYIASRYVLPTTQKMVDITKKLGVPISKLRR